MIAHAAITHPAVPQTRAAYRLEVQSGMAGLVALTPAWEALANQVGQRAFFHSPAWYHAYLSALETEPESVHFVTLYRGERLEVVLPVKRQSRGAGPFHLSVLSLPHHPHMPLSDIVLAPNADLREVARTLASELPRVAAFPWDMICFHNVLEGSGARRLAAAAEGIWSLAVQHGYSDYLPPMPYERRLATLSKNFRGNLRKGRNKLRRLDEVRIITARSVPELEALYREFLEVESQGWKGAAGSGSAIALHPELIRFYHDLLHEFGAQGECEINVLHHGEQIIAAQFALLVNGSCHLLKIGYNEAYRHLAPGNMLLEHILQRSETDPQAQKIDFVSDSRWHQDWRPVQRRSFRLYLCNDTPVGHLLYLAAHGREVTRAIYLERLSPLIESLRKRLGALPQ